MRVGEEGRKRGGWDVLMLLKNGHVYVEEGDLCNNHHLLLVMYAHV